MNQETENHGNFFGSSIGNYTRGSLRSVYNKRNKSCFTTTIDYDMEAPPTCAINQITELRCTHIVPVALIDAKTESKVVHATFGGYNG